MTRTFLSIAAMLILAGLAWFGVTQYQKKSQEAERRSVTAFAGKFYGEIELAKSTPRHSLSNRIADMQQTRQQVLALDIKNACVAAARDTLSLTMNSYIYEFRGFLAQNRGAGNFTEANEKFDKYQDQINACRGTKVKN